MVEIFLQNLVTTFLQVDVPMILSGSNLGRKPVTKTRTSKDSFKTVKKNLYQHNLYKKICTKKANSNKTDSFLYQTFPQENPTNKSFTKSPYPPKKIYISKNTEEISTNNSFTKTLAQKNKDISDNKNLAGTFFRKKQGNPLQKRTVRLSKTNNYIKETHAFFLQKKQSQNIQTFPQKFAQKVFTQNLFWTKQKRTKTKSLHQTMVIKFDSAWENAFLDSKVKALIKDFG